METHQTNVSTEAQAYLDLLKGCLTRSLFPEQHAPVAAPLGTWQHALFKPVRRLLAARNLELVRHTPFDPDARAEGRDSPAHADTMIGLRRLENVEDCVVDVLGSGVPGDLIETGVWRGGTTIFMRAILRVYGDTVRRVWVADSFEGLPRPDTKHWPQDQGDEHFKAVHLAISLEKVRDNFARYGLLDDQVRFLPGFFRDTLPTAPIEQIAVLRLDGDMYGSTMEALKALYPKVSPGGYVIVDDYGGLEPCRQAVADYRAAHGITDPIERVDWTGVWWRKADHRATAGPAS